MSITRSAETTSQGYRRPAIGRQNADVLVVCDTPSPKTHQDGRPLSPRHMEVFARSCQRAGLEGRDFRFVGLAPPIAREDMSSAARKWAHCEPHAEELRHLGANHRLVVTFGELASRAMLGRAVKITKTRGLIQRREGLPPILPMLAPGFVERIPDHLPTFEADVHMIARLRDVDYDPEQVMAGIETHYEWCTDLRPLIERLRDMRREDPPLVLAVDTEGYRLRWWDPEGYGLTVQICTEPGRSLVVPLCERYYPELAEERGGPGADLVRAQVERVLTHPKIRLIGHNVKYDAQILEHRHGIDTWDRWLHDTYLMAWCVDENMMNKDLATCTRIWVPEMAGYCVVPETQLLTADMRRVYADDVQPGDELVGFDEHCESKRRRRMRVAEVEAVERINKPCYRIMLASGRQITVSDNHQFLRIRENHGGGRLRWRQARQLREGDILKTFPWERECASREAGWLAGIVDGEGWLCSYTGSGNVLRMGWAQLPGRVLDESIRVAGALDIKVSCTGNNKGRAYAVTLGPWDTMRSLQILRPIRMLDERKWVGSPLPTRGEDRVVSIEYVGEREVMAIRTSTHTFIADGICSHNSDEFDQEVDKERMDLVPHDKMLDYAGGDPDATLRLARRLKPLLDRDPGQRYCYRTIQMPALKTFGRVVERYGVKVDRGRLRDFATRVNNYLEAEHHELVRLAPAAAKRKHFRSGKALSLTRADFVRDILFTPGISFGLEPCAWTESTKDLPPERRVPSTSAKDHLPYFVADRTPLPSRVESRALELGGEDDRPPIETVGDYCERLRQWVQANKMRTTYIGDEDEGTGFWQYLDREGCVHPSYGFRTNTGRTASNDPNGQNFPSRGSLAKAYMRIFVPRPGFKFVKCDFSQIELRLIAWESMDPTMLAVYANDGDIHITTAAGVLRVTEEEFLALPEAERKRWRTNAKPVNFGYAYGQGAPGFQVYAKTQYGVDFTLQECHEHRDSYFSTYSELLNWHERRKEEARCCGGVRALHGGYRHLPSIYSDDRRIVSQAERQAVNAPIQRVASDFACIAMNRFTERTDPDRVRILGHIHDALWMEALDDGSHVEDCAASLRYIMETLPLGDMFGIESPIPIKADCEIGEDGGSFEERPDVPAEWSLS